MLYDPDHLLAAYLNKHTRRARAIYLVVILMAIAGIVMLPVVKISLTVQGRGIIRPVSEKTEIRSIQSEMVSRICIREGQRVRKGDTLLVLHSDALSGRIGLLSREIDRINRHRLDLSQLTGPDEPELSSMLYTQQYSTYIRNLAELDERIRQAATETERNRHLLDREIIPARDYEKQAHALRLLEEEKGILVSGQMAEWKADLYECISQEEDLKQQLDEAREEQNLYLIIAPVDGTVEEFRGIYEGSMLYAGETIAVISPDAEMIVEVMLPAGDIGHVFEGQKANIQVDAFNHQQWGSLDGTITHISDDFILVDNVPAFVIKCRLDKDILELPNGIKGSLRKGMTVNACFLLAKSSLLQLLLQRSDEWLNPSRFMIRQGQ